MQERTFKRVRNTVVGISGSVLVYSLGLMSLSAYSYINATPLKNQSHLEEVLKAEMKKLGLENKKIDILNNWHAPKPMARSDKIGEGHYKITLFGSEAHNTSTLKHEIYHIADGHCDSKHSKPERMKNAWDWTCYWFYYEPQAVVYAATGLEL